MVRLQRATGLAQRSLHPDEMLPLLLHHLRDMFHADIAETAWIRKPRIISPPSHRAREAVAILTPLTSTQRGACGRASLQRARASCSPNAPSPAGEHFSSLGINDAIVAPVSYEDGPPGILTIANRVGDFSTFGTEDLHLLEALAKHIGVTIRNSGPTPPRGRTRPEAGRTGSSHLLDDLDELRASPCTGTSRRCAPPGRDGQK